MFNYQAFYLPGLIFLATIGLGFSVKAGGRPYNQLLFNIHKLVALAGVVLVVLRLIRSDFFPALSWAGVPLIILAAIGILSLFVTGALMSIQEELNRGTLRIHQISPTLILLATALFYYLTKGT